MKKGWMLLGAAAGAATGVAVIRSRQQAQLLAERSLRLRDASAAHGRNIVVLGAGFGGLNAAAELLHRLPPASGWRITLVDRHNYFLFTPLLYHAATGLVDPSSILFPVRTLSHAENFSFREATVQAVDLRRQVVHLDDGQLSYDHLVLALGSVTNFFGQEEQARAALTIKTAADAVSVRNRIIDAFEAADIAEGPEERRKCLTFVVVGGGATGIELAGAIRGLVTGTLARQYPHVRPEEVRIVVFEALQEILPGLPRELAAYSAQRLGELGVELRLGCPVARVDRDGLTTREGERVPSRTVIWAAGVRPAPIAERLEVPRLKNGRIEVDEHLQVRGVPNVYALGDIAACLDPESEKPLPPTAQVAVQQGKALAEILLARLERREAPPFRYAPQGELVSLGRHDAVAEVKGVRLTGLPAWVLWRAVYLTKLMGFRNRLSVALDWSFAYLYQRETVRLDFPGSGMESEETAERAEEEEETLATRV
jgi:NADH dehydrogenase